MVTDFVLVQTRESLDKHDPILIGIYTQLRKLIFDKSFPNPIRKASKAPLQAISGMKPRKTFNKLFVLRIFIYHFWSSLLRLKFFD